MESSSGRDLFEGFNKGEVNEVLRRCTDCGKFVLIGPPRSGKTFFREKYLKGVTVVEHTLGLTTTAETEGEEEASTRRDRIFMHPVYFNTRFTGYVDRGQNLSLD